MSLSLNLGNQTVDLTNSSDLVKFLVSNSAAEFKFISDPTQFANQTLNDIPNEGVSLAFSIDKQLAWDLGTNGSVTFGFSPSASAGLSIKTSGDLFSYTMSDTSDPVKISIPAGVGYVSLTLNVSIGVSAGASFSSGNFGVSANGSDSNTFAISFRKAFPLNTGVLTAITSAFESFTLPFQPDGIARLKDGDFLEYQYLGSIKAGFGVTYGITGNLLGGRSAPEITQSFTVSNLAQVLVNVKPNFQAAASFAFAYDHEDVFHVVVARQSKTASLVYFRGDSNRVTTTETLGITLNAGATFDLSSRLPTAAGRLAASAFAGVAGALGASGTSGLAGLLSNAASNEVQKYIDDVNNSVNGLLSKADGLKIELQLQQERLDQNTALFSFEFDLTQPEAISKGYPLAMAGNFVDAIQVPGVDLDPGSFVEHLWSKSSSVSFNFFGLFRASDVTQYFRDTQLVYVGHNQFRIVSKTGLDRTVSVNSAQNDCEVYFSASAPANNSAVSPKDLVVSLNFKTVDHTASAAQETKRALIFMGGSSLQTAAAAIPNSISGSLTINCQFPQDAFTRFSCDEYNGNRPLPLPHPNDSRNYTTFAAAVQGIAPSDIIDQDFLRFFASYDSWVEFNRVKIDQEGSQMTPDRRSTGNLAVTVWPDALDSIGQDERTLLQCYIYADQHFMNLCESLEHLGSTLATINLDVDLNQLQNSLSEIIKQNINVFFIKPTLAALFRLSNSSAGQVQVATSGDDVTMVFQVASTEAASTQVASTAAGRLARAA